MKEETPSLPAISGPTGLKVLLAMLRGRSVLDGLRAMHAALGSPFQIALPGFKPVVVADPEANRDILVTSRDRYHWRTETDPVTRLLRRGVLVVDGEEHDALRALMDPYLQRGRVRGQEALLLETTDRFLDSWREEETRDMLVEMRRLALLLLIAALFGEDAEPDLDRIWGPILKSIAYISPGTWILWPGAPRPGYAAPLADLDRYLYDLIEKRRASGAESSDLLSALIRCPELDDDLIRDQLLTMLIAGHDTSTALLAWTLYLLGEHPETMRAVREEIDRTLPPLPDAPDPERFNRLPALDAVIKESLRLYPPIHVGNRRAAEEVQIQGCPVAPGERVMVSIYLSQRDPAHWEDPDRFRPERFLGPTKEKNHPFAYLPFGGGPRNCIGASFAQVEARIVLARIIQRFDLELRQQSVRAHMGATLEPRPGVRMRIRRRPPGEPS